MAFVSIDQLLGKITSLMFFNFLKEETLIPISGNDGAPIYCPIEHHEYWYALNGFGKYEGMSPQERKAIWTQIGEDDDILSPRDEAKRTNRRENGGSWRYLYIHTQEDPEHILQHVRGEAKEQGNKLIAFLKAHNAYFDEHGVRRILNETGRVEGKYGPDWQYVRNLTLEEFLHGPIPDFTDSGTCPPDEPIDPERLTREALTEKIEEIRGFELRRLEEERASWDVKTAITVAEASQKRSILRELDSQIANVKDAPLEAFVTAPFGTEDAFFSVQKQLLGLEPCPLTAQNLGAESDATTETPDPREIEYARVKEAAEEIESAAREHMNDDLFSDDPPGTTIKRHGNGYIVTFQGNNIVLPPKMDGSRYIYHLIKVYAEDTDREPLSAMDLENLVKGTAPIEPTSYDLGAALDDGLNVVEQFSESDLDAKGEEDLRKHMASLKTELEEAERNGDLGRVEKLRLEIDKLKDCALKEYTYDPEKGAMLKRGTGSISNSDHKEKAKNRVRRNVNTLLDNLASEQETKAFAQHMRDSITYGKKPRYAPSTPINWTVK